MHNFLHMKSPCANCPFRKDSLKGWLGEERMAKILSDDSFVCHKTTLDGKSQSRRQCAGFMLIKWEESSYVKVANHLGINLKLSGRELVFASKEDCIAHHKQ